MNIMNINSPTFKRLEINYDAESTLFGLPSHRIHEIRKFGMSLENGTHFNLHLDKDLKPTIRDNSKLFSYYEMPYEIIQNYGKANNLILKTKEVSKISGNEEKKDVELSIRMKNAKEMERVYNKVSENEDNIETATIFVNLLDREAKKRDDEEFCLNRLSSKSNLIDNVLYNFGTHS